MQGFRPKARFVAVVGCVVAVFLATACSSAEDDSGSAMTLKIGLISDITGDFSPNYTHIAEVAQAWTDWVNDTQGGVNGHPVELIVKDTKSQQTAAAGMARELVESDDVAAVFVQSGTAQPLIWEYLDSQGVPLIGGNNGTVGPDTPSTFFTIDIGFPAISEAGAVVANLAGADSIAAAVCAEVAGCQSIGETLGEFAPTVGVEDRGVVTIARTATSATAQCLALVDSGAEIVATFLSLVPTQRLIESCKGQGFTGRFMNVGATTQATFDELGTDPILGVMYDFPWWSDADPVVQFREVMEEHGVSEYRSFSSTNLWALLQLFAYALEESGPEGDATVTGPAVVEALRSAVQGVTLDGLLPQPITFSESGNTEVACFWAIERQGDGSFTTLEGSGESGNGVKGDLASVCS